MDWITWINTIVGVIGIVVGIIGWKSLTTAAKINNKAKADNGASIQQAQVINNGLDSYAVIRLSKETTQEEVTKLIEKVQPLTETDVERLVEEKTKQTAEKVAKIQRELDGQIKHHIVRDGVKPDDMQEGHIYWTVR